MTYLRARRARAMILGLAAIIVVGCESSDGTLVGGLKDPEGQSEEAAGLMEDGATPTPQAPTPVPTPTSQGPSPIEVLAIMAETGVLERLDGRALSGIRARVDLLNAEGGLLGRKVELTVQNTDSRLSKAERFARRLDASPPDLLLVSCDVDFSGPVLEAAHELGLVTISPCAGDWRYSRAELGQRNFTLGTPAADQGAIAAQVALETLEVNSSVLLRDITSPEGLAFCEGFEQRYLGSGGVVTQRLDFRYDTLAPLEDRLASFGSNAEAAVLCTHAPGDNRGAPEIVRLIRQSGYEMPLIGGSSLDERDWFDEVGSTLGELTIISWSSIHGNDPDEQVNLVIRRSDEIATQLGVEELEGSTVDRQQVVVVDEPVGSTTVLGADSITVWARAVESVGTTDYGAVASAMTSFTDQAMLTGRIGFAPGSRMDRGRDYRVLQISDGKLSVVEVRAFQAS